MTLPHNLMGFEQDSQMLEMNMACITNELSDLVLGSNGNPPNAFISGCPLAVPIHEHAYIASVEQLRYSNESLVRMNCEANMQPPEARPIVAARPRSQSVDFNVHQLSMARGVPSNERYKRRASAADVMGQHEALLCAAIEKSSPDSHLTSLQSKRCGVRRRYSRTEPKEPIDYDSVVIDLKAIGLSTSNRERNDVLRLFGLFRKLHHYLNDKIVCAAEHKSAQLTRPVPLMPSTMNVHTQIKHAIHKCNAFCFRLFEKLDEHKLADREKYLECYRSVSLLRKIVKQFEPFKEAELEHKNGVFVNSFGAAQAKNLEILLSQLIVKVRESNILVELFLSSVKSSAETVVPPSMETLKKAFAIAGAMCGSSRSKILDKKDDGEPRKVPQNEEQCGGDKSAQSEGIAAAALSPTPDINRSRFLGV